MMAVHVVTALAQLAQELGVHKAQVSITDPNWESLETATRLSCWTEDLDSWGEENDWGDLVVIVKSRGAWELHDWLQDVAPKYLAQWAELGFPVCREDWVKTRLERSAR